MVRRLLSLAALIALAVIAPAAPALAHGGGGSDATNFRSEVDRVVEGDGTAAAASPVELDGVTWRVRALDSYLEVSNRSGAELLVYGYEGEPYLRIGPDRVLENRNSPAVYLNNDRFAETPVPPGVAANAEPDWVEVGAEPVYRWHDHRIHWMAQTEPPQVKTDPRAVHVIQDWTVPFTLGGNELSVQGQLQWVPPPPPWPWLIGAAIIGILTMGAAFVTARGAGRSVRLRRVGAGLVGVLVLLNVVHAIDDVLAVPATLGENLYALAQSLIFIGMGGFGAVRGWRGGEGGPTALAIGAGALFVGVGLTHLGSLTSSQVASTLPAAFTRAVVASNIAALPPVLLAVAYVLRKEAPVDAPGDDATTAVSEAT
ncbi:MAG: hypothetical protein GEU74_10190 [Nitriliruptorales bacterium]|nr:hypothetical protein [Nitriliruptorales bacterium]